MPVFATLSKPSSQLAVLSNAGSAIPRQACRDALSSQAFETTPQPSAAELSGAGEASQ